MKPLPVLLRVGVLTVILLVAHILAATLAGLASTGKGGGVRQAQSTPTTTQLAHTADPTVSEQEAIAARKAEAAEKLKLFGAVAGVCLLESLAIAIVVLGARTGGWRLMAGLVAAQFGTMTLQPQIEALAFGVVGSGLSARIIAMGAALAVIVAPLAALLFGRSRTQSGDAQVSIRAAAANRPGRVFLISALVYVALYLAFGYFIAWQSPAVREYYGGAASTGFLSHLWSLQRQVPWFLPFQFVRGILWAAIGLILLPLLTGSWLRKGVVLGIFLAIMMNAQLLLPNHLMPQEVRLVHIVETAPCNLIFGILLAWLCRPVGRGDDALLQHA